MTTHTINLCSEFSREPFGRVKEHGPNNGTRFRNEFLIPSLRKFDKVIVTLDGASYGSSFLEESFGGLVRLGYFEPNELLKRLEWHHNLVSTRDRITNYIKQAQFGAERNKAAQAEADYPIPA